MVQVAQPAWPLGVTGADEPDPSGTCRFQLAFGIQSAEPGGNVGRDARHVFLVAQKRVDLGSTQRPHESGQPGVTGLAQPAQRGACDAFGHPALAVSSVATLMGSPVRRRSATSSSRIPGTPTPARSATVHASRWTRVAPRRVSSPEYTRSVK